MWIGTSPGSGFQFSSQKDLTNIKLLNRIPFVILSLLWWSPSSVCFHILRRSYCKTVTVTFKSPQGREKRKFDCKDDSYYSGKAVGCLKLNWLCFDKGSIWQSKDWQSCGSQIPDQIITTCMRQPHASPVSIFQFLKWIQVYTFLKWFIARFR